MPVYIREGEAPDNFRRPLNRAYKALLEVNRTARELRLDADYWRARPDLADLLMDSLQRARNLLDETEAAVKSGAS